MAGSLSDFEEVFRVEFAPVERTVYLVCHDREQAKEITQEAFVALLRRWRQVSRYERPGAWVRRVAIRLAIRSVRRERSRLGLERQAQALLPPPAEPSGGITVWDVDVLAAVRTLPARQRAAVALFYLDERSMTEVADLMGCSPATARVHLHRARSRLAKLLSEREAER